MFMEGPLPEDKPRTSGAGAVQQAGASEFGRAG